MEIEKVLIALFIAMVVAGTCIVMGAVTLMTVFGWLKHASDWMCNILDINGHKDQH